MNIFIKTPLSVYGHVKESLESIGLIVLKDEPSVLTEQYYKLTIVESDCLWLDSVDGELERHFLNFLTYVQPSPVLLKRVGGNQHPYVLEVGCGLGDVDNILHAFKSAVMFIQDKPFTVEETVEKVNVEIIKTKPPLWKRFIGLFLLTLGLYGQQQSPSRSGGSSGGGDVNLTGINGTAPGLANALAVQPGTGAVWTVTPNGGSFNVTLLNASIAVTQSGNWSMRLQDGAGNAITSRSTGSARPADVAIVDGSGNQITSFGGGTQYSAGSSQATPTGTVSLGKDSGDILRAVRTNTSGQAEVICVSGCTAGGSFSDNSSFTAGATAISNNGGVYDDGLAAVTSGNGAAARITANRGIHTNLRNASGTEIGTAGSPLRVDPTGSTTQPVSGTITVGTFPDNEPFNLAQLGGNTVSTGNGTAGTGTLRVSIASDSTGNVGATQSGNWSTRTQDGFGNTISSTGGSLNVNCTGGCSSPTIEQTWTAGVVSSASAPSKDYLTVFNGVGSGKILKVQKIRISSSNTAAVTGVGFSAIFSRVTANGTTCTTVTPAPFDTTNTALPAEVVANTNCTSDPTGLTNLGSCGINSDETGAVQQADCFISDIGSVQPIFLREGQGILIQNTALAPVGLMAVFVQFTVI